MSTPPSAGSGLAGYEMPRPFVEPALRMLGRMNMIIDALFYDVGVLARDLRAHGELIAVQTAAAGGSAKTPDAVPGIADVDLTARDNPEGCILVVDAAHAPYVTRFDRVDAFLQWANTSGTDVAVATVTGIGSSALGSAAFAWNVSMALGRRVAAVVPGYGVADVVNQALGGWFGLGLHSWIEAMSRASQSMLVRNAPGVARIGHRLLASTPGNVAAGNAAPEFQTGSAASDVLHSILHHGLHFDTVVGHSKGALAIGNALGSLDADIVSRLSVVTFGCPIGERAGVRYRQFLGAFDAVGLLNSWGNLPDEWIATDHSTNTRIPLSIPTTACTRSALAVVH